MRVLVTGASGFIGAHCVRELLDRGHQVAILTRSADRPSRLKEVAGRIERIEGALGNVPRAAIQKWEPEGCLHLAWYAEPGKYLEADENVDCLIGSLALLRTLILDGCERFVGAGTCFEYEMAGHPLQESSPARPATLYAAAKLSLCEMGQKLARQKGAKFAWGRVFYPYGPQEDPRRALPGVINALLDSRPFPATTGEQVRDYVHVEDVAAGFATLLDSGAEGVFNLCSGAPLTMRELLSLIGEQLGKAHLLEFGKFPARSYDPSFIAGDNSRLRSLGWSPRYTTASGVAQTIEWWRANRKA